MARAVDLLLALVPLIALFLLQSSYPKPLAPHERVLLLTAHPDDECFFFGPTLLALSEQGTAVYSLCVSNGSARLPLLGACLTSVQYQAIMTAWVYTGSRSYRIAYLY